jgi:hypothetical protein
MLPIEWVDKLFQKFGLIYGVDVARRYQGLDPAEIKRQWQEALAGFKDNPAAIKFALDHLPPDRCPNVLQFRDLCRQAPPKQMLKLDLGKANKEVVDNEIRKLVADAFIVNNHLDWAYKLKKRHESGERLSATQIKAYQEALNAQHK